MAYKMLACIGQQTLHLLVERFKSYQSYFSSISYGCDYLDLTQTNLLQVLKNDIWLITCKIPEAVLLEIISNTFTYSFRILVTSSLHLVGDVPSEITPLHLFDELIQWFGLSMYYILIHISKWSQILYIITTILIIKIRLGQVRLQPNIVFNRNTRDAET